MNKVIKAYCVSKVEKGLRSYQMDDPRRWSTDIRSAYMYPTEDECKSMIQDEIDSWNRYIITYPDYKKPKYEILELEVKVINKISYHESN